ncbi:MAG: hypothetical protein ACE5LF_07455 [Alphaproteobacteria bacterium]
MKVVIDHGCGLAGPRLDELAPPALGPREVRVRLAAAASSARSWCA